MSEEYRMTPELEQELKRPYLEHVERITATRGGGYWATMFRLRDRSLAAIFRAGAPHVGNHSRLDMIRSRDGGKTWPEQWTAVPATGSTDVRGSAAGVMADGTLVCGYVEDDWYASGTFSVEKTARTSWYRYSEDDGRTWSEKMPLKAAPIIHPTMYGRTVVLDDGTALMAVYGATEDGSPGDPWGDVWGAQTAGVVRSTDNGRTWGDLSIIAAGFNETTLSMMPDGRLLAFMRKDGRAVGIWQSESTDRGRTWTGPVAVTGAHQHPADVTLLQSGTLLLTYGNRIGDLAVGAVISDDLGRTWNRDARVILARGSLVLKGKTWGDTGYPTTLQEEDGTINTLYYRVGHNTLPPDQQELFHEYEHKAFSDPPAPDDMRRFEEGICVRYTEEQLLDLMR